MKRSCGWLLVALIAVLLAACGGGSGGDEVVAPANNAPAADAGANVSVAPGDTVTLNASGSSDLDGQTLTFTWEQISGTSVTLSATDTAIITFTAPDVTTAESLIFRVTVSDGVVSVADEVTITCSTGTVTLPPLADAGSDQTGITVGSIVTLNGSGSMDPGDPSGASLTYAWTQTGAVDNASVTLSDPAITKPTFTAPSLPIGEDLTFSLTVSNGTDSSVDTVIISVSLDPNTNSPLAIPGDDQKVTSGDAVTLDGSKSSDPNNASLTYSWRQISGTAVNLNGADTDTATFTAPDGTGVENLVFSLTVSNGQYQHTAQTVVIVNLLPDIKAPTVVSTTPKDGKKSISVSTAVSVVFDEAMDPASITDSFILDGGGTVDGKVTYESDTFTATFTPDALLAVNTLHKADLDSTITDLAGNHLASLTFTFTTGTDSSPLAAAGDDQFVSWADNVVLDGSGSSDVETLPNNLLYSWTQTAGVNVTLIDANTSSPSFRSGKLNVETLIFELSVTDEDGHVTTDTVNITVLEDVAHAVFVFPNGNDADAGTREAPFKTIGEAISKANLTFPKSDVYVGSGDYVSSTTVTIADGVSLYGGFKVNQICKGLPPVCGSPTGWTRTATAETKINGAPTMLGATAIINPTVVDGFTIESANGSAGANSTAILALSSSALRISNNVINAGKGGPGAARPDGIPGSSGDNGGLTADYRGGIGGVGPCDNGGGDGGDGLLGLSGEDGAQGSGAIGGDGGTGGIVGNLSAAATNGGSGKLGESGASGSDGNDGDGSGSINPKFHTWVPNDGKAGVAGGNGSGGGGGGAGGGYNINILIKKIGGGGSAGGGGGCGGTGGTGGDSGGGSFGIFLSSSSPDISGNTITTAGGGDGGLGGSGGTGGAGGEGRTVHSLSPCLTDSSIGCGGDGGDGGSGGDGGAGGDGGGGVSFGIYRAELSSPTMVDNTFTIGAGGTSAGNGTTGKSGDTNLIK